MIDIPFILITLLIGFILLGVLVALLIRKLRSERVVGEPDYRAFFIMGISFLPAGIIFTTVINPGFLGIFVMGLIYTIVGLANRDKWKKQ